MGKKLDYIDSLRGIAVLGVLMVHIGAQALDAGSLRSVTEMGAKGVQLFFFVSAFTLFLSYNNRKDREVYARRNFFIRRFFRIAPLYYLGILYYSFQTYYSTGAFHPATSTILNFTFLHGFSPYYINSLVPGGWSIGVEMLFYLLVPFLIFIITNLNRAIALLILSLVIRYLFTMAMGINPFQVTDHYWTGFLYWSLPNQLPCFAFGILFYFVQLNVAPAGRNSTLKRVVLPLVTLLIAAIGIDKLIFKAGFFNNDAVIMVAILLFALFISAYPLKAIVNRFTILVGKLSFSIYIIHFAVIYWMHRFDFDWTGIVKQDYLIFLIQYLIVLCATVGISWVTYNLIEVPFQRVARTLIEKSKSKAALSGAFVKNG